MPSKCTIPDCESPEHCRGWCHAHYWQWWKHGDPLHPNYRHRDAVAYFWTKVNKTKTCWLWKGTIMLNGYGQFKTRNQRHLAHRFAYNAVRGAIPDGLQLDHLCRVRACVNPDHLEPVTGTVNILRGESPGAKNARS